jgi:hypothetical protein
MLANKYVAKLILSDNLVRILANLHNLVQGFTNDERLADQLNKTILKTFFKLYVLKRNNMFNEHEFQLFDELSECLNSSITTFVKLYGNYTVLNRFFLIRQCQRCQRLLHDIIINRQTRRSHERIDFIFSHLSNAEFLKYVFDSKSTFNHATVRDMIVDMGLLMNQTLI